ncbi:hypothetical protein [Legionella oakridgensis]|uniref:Peptidase C80 family n=2 Tax=Legionella oakridgensis TaxID=29423 RepID=W0BE19_9GAMM|nr:hypothetical protein [Legionella oakridgensis]AHE66664.1 peptidase C80 family [Legionella oakridgensis ATCC 33761 = DSM 21215]KTD37745.1 hypothetical protein Loak_1421 [Legionella oakridgensis]STY19803.1 Uncharacterised protein [Legionella longbeachae]
MTILYLDDNDKDSADALAEVYGDRALSFDEVRGRTLRDRDITLCAHTDDDRATIGGKTPRELAQELARKYGDHKSSLQDIYLISCEAGIGQPSLAQQLARELRDAGFAAGIRIHAANPVNADELHGMRVEVVTKPGAWSTEARGDVRAFFYGNEHSYEVDSRIEAAVESHQTREATRLFRARKNDALYVKTDIFNSHDYKEELNRAHHTFTTDGPGPRPNRAVLKAIETLQAIIAAPAARNALSEEEKARLVPKLLAVIHGWERKDGQILVCGESVKRERGPNAQFVGLKDMPEASVEDIIAKLNEVRGVLGKNTIFGSSNFQTVIDVVTRELHALDEPMRPYHQRMVGSRPSTPPAVHPALAQLHHTPEPRYKHGTARVAPAPDSATQVRGEALFHQALQGYIAERQKVNTDYFYGGWTTFWNWIANGLRALCGMEQIPIKAKSKDVKIAAAGRLSRGEALSEQELAATKEGRLGDLVRARDDEASLAKIATKHGFLPAPDKSEETAPPSQPASGLRR